MKLVYKKDSSSVTASNRESRLHRLNQQNYGLVGRVG